MTDSSHSFPADPAPGQTAFDAAGELFLFDPAAGWQPWSEERGRALQPPQPFALPDASAYDALEDAVAALQNQLLASDAPPREEAPRASLQQRADAAAARDRLARQHTRPDPENLCADIYDGDYAAVIAEVPPGVRRDGWTVERRLLFLERLAECGSILAAARAAGVSRRSVYKLAPRAPAFAAALDEAMRTANQVLADTLFDRAVHGHEVPIVHKGEVVATRTVHHDALGCYLLRVRDPLNYAPVDELDRWLHRRGADPRQAALPRGAGESLPPPPAGLAGSAAGHTNSTSSPM
nr:hypothetical protein [uncultured Sphingomonas sp.]